MFFGFSQKQKRSSEDRYQIKTFGDFTYYAVFDGHGGLSRQKVNVVDFCQQHLHDYLELHLKNVTDTSDTTQMVEAIKNTFIFFDKEMFLAKMHGGSTCTMLLIDNKNGFIYQINLGDSRSIIFDHSLKIISVTKDHKPTDQDEKIRIFQSGQFVNIGRVSGILAVSRAFGDFDEIFKFVNGKYDSILSSVSVVPDVNILRKGPWRILMMSDAPFESDFYSNTKLVEISQKLRSLNVDPMFISSQLVSDIDTRTTDDITIIYIEL